MPVPLPKPIELFMSSENTHDLEALADCFTARATVRDEGQTMQGLKAIKAWRLETSKKYRHTVEPLAVTVRDGKTVVSTTLTGDFPGSSITLDFVFTLEGAKIAALEVQS
jgi:hypothetical protein